MTWSEANKALNLPRQQLGRVERACWDPPDPVEAVTWAFYAYENSIVATAEAVGEPWSRNHYLKAELAASLVEKQVLKTNVKDLLLDLNGRRKDAAYSGEEPGDEGEEEIDLERLASDLRAFVQEVTSVVNSKAP